MIDGPSGTGKTWMLTMLGKQACLGLLRVEYYRFSKFLELLAGAREGNQMNSLLEQFRRCSVLMIDDFGLSSVSSDAASDLLTVLTEREGRSSVAIASQLPFEEWLKSLGGGHSADAIIDRLLNTCYKFNLDGRSLSELKMHGMK